MKTLHFITIKNKKYPYFLEKKSDGNIRFLAKDAKIDQSFLPEDIAGLIIDLPNLILAEQNYIESQNEIIRFRVSGKDKLKIEKKAVSKGYTSISKYLRDLALK
jgi:hypothetical protein